MMILMSAKVHYLQHMYTPHMDMTNFNLDDDEPSTYIFYIRYMQLDEQLKEGDIFRLKDECVRAIKKFHMVNSVDFKVDLRNAERSKIRCTNEECMFRLKASYRS